MNLALLLDEDFVAPDRAVLRGRRLQHLREVLGATTGEDIRVGRLNGPMGMGTLVHLDDLQAELRVHWDAPPPEPLPLTLIVALPRPKMIRRILQTAATMGVKRLCFINAYKVEKSYWQSPWLQPDALMENLILGLEQGRDTQLPQVTLHKRFKPFVEDELPELSAGQQRLVAHPGTQTPCPTQVNQPVCLCIGPEGGFIPYEVDLLMRGGFIPVHLGSRILRVETAVPVLAARLFDSCRY